MEMEGLYSTVAQIQPELGIKTLLENGSWHQSCFITCSLNFGGWKGTVIVLFY